MKGPTHFNYRHGMGGSKLYHVWRQMQQRCTNPAHKDYPAWGGRGITVCAEWSDPLAFKAWAESNGYRDGVTIERIDNMAGYSPGNCRWISNRLQAKNTRRQRMVTIDGVLMDVADLARSSGINYTTLITRLNLGWPHDRLTVKAIRGRNQYSGGEP